MGDIIKFKDKRSEGQKVYDALMKKASLTSDPGEAAKFIEQAHKISEAERNLAAAKKDLTGRKVTADTILNCLTNFVGLTSVLFWNNEGNYLKFKDAFHWIRRTK